MARQESCPLSSVQPALLIYQIVSSLSTPGDQPPAQGPGRSGYINTSAAFVLVLTPCFSAQANRPLATSLQRSKTPLSPQSVRTATETSLFPASRDCFSAYVAMKGQQLPETNTKRRDTIKQRWKLRRKLKTTLKYTNYSWYGQSVSDPFLKKIIILFIQKDFGTLLSSSSTDF